MPKFLRLFSYKQLVMLVIAGVVLGSSFVAWPHDIALAADVTVSGAADVNTTTDPPNHNSPNLVFVSDTTGYAFYISSGRNVVYTKTTDGGATWSTGSPVTIQNGGGDEKVAVWYDKWTPGGTGTLIHMAYNSSSTIWYRTLDTSGDTLGTQAQVNSNSTLTAGFSNSQANTNGRMSITKGTDAALYISIQDGKAATDESAIVRCTATCTTNGNWSISSGSATTCDAGPTLSGVLACTPSGNPNSDNDEDVLLPIASGHIVLVKRDTVGDSIGISEWDGSSWSAYSIKDSTGMGPNSTYEGSIGATVDKQTSTVYILYMHDNGSLGGAGAAADDIKTATYTSAGGWTQKTAVLTDDTKQLVSARIGISENSAALYAVYTGGTSPAASDVYFKRSTDGMTSWGTQTQLDSAAAAQNTGASINITSADRIYAMWAQLVTGTPNTSTWYGTTVDDIAPPTYEQADYRLYANADSTDVGSTLAALNTPATLSPVGAVFRLRQLFRVSGDGVRVGLDTFKLQYPARVRVRAPRRAECRRHTRM